jgi:hypothetical protein
MALAVAPAGLFTATSASSSNTTSSGVELFLLPFFNRLRSPAVCAAAAAAAAAASRSVDSTARTLPARWHAAAVAAYDTTSGLHPVACRATSRSQLAHCQQSAALVVRSTRSVHHRVWKNILAQLDASGASGGWSR